MTESKDGPAWADYGVAEAELASLRAAAPGMSGLVESIRGGDRSAAIDALFHLKNEICHQGMAISSRTPIVLPFLIALLSCRTLPARVELFELVRQVAQASSAWRRAANDAGSAYAENYREKIGWEVAVDRIFVDSQPRFEALQQDPDIVISQLAEDLTTGNR